MHRFLILMVFGISLGHAFDDYEEAPIFYSATQATDPVAKLVEQFENGQLDIDRSSEKATLLHLLKLLKVPVESQVLVFSRTSLQGDKISPTTPRAIYFSDDCYVGYVQGGSLEIISIDPLLGPVFYRLALAKSDRSRDRFYRDRSCLDCHGTSRTHGFPGIFVRSVFPDDRGFPILGAGTHMTDHTSPIAERWGGWYVTGEHDGPDHMGNKIYVRGEPGEANLVQDHGRRLKNLTTIINPRAYPRSDSDIVALMVLEHQVLVHNVMSQANHSVRRRLHQNDRMAKHFDHAPGELSETTKSLINNQATALLKAMLMSNEAELTGWGIEGGNDFQEAFAKNSLTAGRRSLKDLQLLSRLFKYRMSYVIYTEAFDALPKALLAAFYDRLFAILNGKNSDPAFSHLKETEKKRILEILIATKTRLPESWHAARNPAN